MVRKSIYLLIIVPVLAALAACSSLNLPGTTSATGQNQAQAASGSTNAPANTANQPVESKLAVGTLKLEGTGNAVTAEQARTLLPLWKAVKSMSTSSTASPSEMTALYQQIQDAMTAQQVQAIKDMTLDQAATQDLMKQYNVQMPQMPTPNATQMAQRSSGNTTNAQGAGGGMMPPMAAWRQMAGLAARVERAAPQAVQVAPQAVLTAARAATQPGRRALLRQGWRPAECAEAA